MELKDELNNYRVMNEIVSSLMGGNPVGIVYAEGRILFGVEPSARVEKYVYKTSVRRFRKEIIEKISELILDELNKREGDKFMKKKVRGSWYVFWNKDKVYFLMNTKQFRDYFEPQFFVFYEVDKARAKEILNSFRVTFGEVGVDGQRAGTFATEGSSA